MIFFAGLPSMNFTAPSLARAAASRSALEASAATVIFAAQFAVDLNHHFDFRI